MIKPKYVHGQSGKVYEVFSYDPSNTAECREDLAVYASRIKKYGMQDRYVRPMEVATALLDIYARSE